MGADDSFVHRGALEQLYSEMRRHRDERFDVGRFKTLTGLTRKHAIPLLEHLDQARVTRRDGEVRIVL
jgi:selenocysteine-specific elongation factor